MRFLIPSYIAFCFFCFFSFACKKESVEGLPVHAFNESFTVHSGEKVLLKNEGSSVLIELHTILDSRCTTHTSCSDEGRAIAKVTLSNANNSISDTFLSIGNSAEPEEPLTIKLDKKFFLVQLNGIYPKPSDKDSGTKPKFAEILIKEQP